MRAERTRRFAWRIGLLIAGLILLLPTWLPADEIPRTGEELTFHIQVDGQPLQGEAITVSEVNSPEDGWLVIYNRQADELGEIIGFTQVEEGISQGVQIPLNPVRAASDLTAVLHRDTPPIGEFNYPSQDSVLTVNGEPIRQDFALYDSVAPASEGQPADPLVISMAADTFDPLRVTIPAGTTVIWRNADDHAHTVVAEDHLFVSPELELGAEFSFTFEQPGQYPYFCELFGGPGGRGMAGVIIVR